MKSALITPDYKHAPRHAEGTLERLKQLAQKIRQGVSTGNQTTRAGIKPLEAYLTTKVGDDAVLGLHVDKDGVHATVDAGPVHLKAGHGWSGDDPFEFSGSVKVGKTEFKASGATDESWSVGANSPYGGGVVGQTVTEKDGVKSKDWFGGGHVSTKVKGKTFDFGSEFSTDGSYSSSFTMNGWGTSTGADSQGNPTTRISTPVAHVDVDRLDNLGEDVWDPFKKGVGDIFDGDIGDAWDSFGNIKSPIGGGPGSSGRP